MKELEIIWKAKIQKISQKRKYDSDDDKDEFSPDKVTAKKRKGLASVRA
jgi:hypothetical protein